MRRIALLLLPLLFLPADHASAYFSVAVNTGSNYAVAHATSLSAPTAMTATGTSTTAMSVDWTLPATQLPGASYVLSRTAPPTATVCTVTAASGTHTCADSGLSLATTYSYSVVATLGSWQSTAATASGATVAPTLSITLANGPYTAGNAYDVQSIRAMVGASTETTYTGTKTITWSGLATSPGPTNRAPSYPTATVTFTNGVVSAGLGKFTAFFAGSNTLTATDSAQPLITGSVSISVVAAAVNKFAVTAPASTTADVSITGIAISAHDAYDNVATTYSGNKSVTWSGPATSPAPASVAPTLPAATVAFTSGNSTTSLTASLRAAGVNTLTATESSRTGSATVTVTNAAASTMAVVSGSGTTAGLSAAYAAPLVASVTDAYSNGVPNASVVFTAPGSGASGTFANGTATTTVTANASGVATSTTFTANATAGAFNVTAASGSLSTSFALTNTLPLAVVSIASANVGANANKAEKNDTFSVTFNNALNPSTVAATGTITLVGSASSTNITISGLTVAGGFTMPAVYETSGQTSSAAGSLALSNGNKTITFTITGSLSNGANVKIGAAAAFTFTPLATIADTSGSSGAAAFSQSSMGLF
jgi:hypothetical protein